MHKQTQRRSREISWSDKEMHGKGWKRGFPGLRTKNNSGNTRACRQGGISQHDFASRMITLSSWLMLYLYHPQTVGDGCVWVKGVRKLTNP
jgi:hypothetical protein